MNVSNSIKISENTWYPNYNTWIKIIRIWVRLEFVRTKSLRKNSGGIRTYEIHTNPIRIPNEFHTNLIRIWYEFLTKSWRNWNSFSMCALSMERRGTRIGTDPNAKLRTNVPYWLHVRAGWPTVAKFTSDLQDGQWCKRSFDVIY